MGEPHGPSVTINGQPNAELVLTHLEGLPTLSAVALRALEVISNPESSAAELIELLRGDQSLTARILSLAGSAWAGTRQPATTIDKAVPLLGFAAIRSIVLTVSVFECFPAVREDGEARAFNRIEFWKHALGVACAAGGFAAARPELKTDPQDAFVAGLLHDIGKVALSAVFPRSYERAAAQANQARCDIAEIERTLFGLDHAAAGHRLAERWRLPSEFQEVIWLHHLAAEALPASVARPALIALVQLADLVTREQRIGYSGNHRFYIDLARAAERLGFTRQQVEGVVVTLVEEVVAHAEAMGLGAEAPSNVYLQAITRANAELGRLNTELTVSGQRLAAGARCFGAISQFDQNLGAWWDPPAVVAAMAQAAAAALQREQAGAFGVRDNRTAVDVAWFAGRTGYSYAAAQVASDELARWLNEAGEAMGGVLMHAPAPVRFLFAGVPEISGGRRLWLLPVVQAGRLSGGLLFVSDEDERARREEELEDLRSFATSLGLALGRANAQAAARRLSDDLAETNRRLQQMQTELLRSRTLSMIAEMAAGAGHELNSPLTVISGRAQMLARTLSDPAEQRALEIICAKAHECSQIVSELMDFARPRPPQLAALELPELLRAVGAEWCGETGFPPARLRLDELPLHGAAQPAAVEVPPGASGAGPENVAGRGDASAAARGQGSNNGAAQLSILGDDGQLRRVFRELIANAADAVAAGSGLVFVSCRPAAMPGFIEALVRDTGCGMTPAVLQRAFDPFFSHRQAGRGRGLGLPRAHRIVEGHSGHIWLESAPEEGTTAHVLLPKA